LRESRHSKSRLWFVAMVVLVVLLAGLAGLLRLWIKTAAPRGIAVGPDKGLLAPDLSARTATGALIRLNDFQGRPVVLSFLASQSEPSRVAVPELETVQTRSDSSAILIGVTSQDTAAAARQFMTQYQLNFPLLLDEGGQIAARYRVREVPATFVIDRDGVIAEIIDGPVTRERLNKALDSLPPSGNELEPIKDFFSSLFRSHLHELS
jgi:cytochrome c biogenesis protein CcmG, thiol:disulfide interchange protein DsbE